MSKRFYKKRALWELNQEKCLYCEKFIDFKSTEIEHIIPESWSRDKIKKNLFLDMDSSDINNLTISCRRCNEIKSDSILPLPLINIFIEKNRKLYKKIPSLIKKYKTDSLDLSMSKDFIQKIHFFKDKEIFPFLFDIDPDFFDKEEKQRLLKKKIKNPLKIMFNKGNSYMANTIGKYLILISKGGVSFEDEFYKQNLLYEIPLKYFDFILKSKKAKFNIIDSPRIGIYDTHLIPNILFLNDLDISDYKKGKSTDINSILKNAEKTTLADYIKEGYSEIKEITSHHIKVSTIQSITTIFELFRRDFSNSGHQEILVLKICERKGFIEGEGFADDERVIYTTYSLKILRKDSISSLFSVIDAPTNTGF